MEPTFTQKVEAPPPLQQSSNFSFKQMDFTWKKLLIGLGFILVVLIMWQWISSPMIVTVSGVGTVSVPASSATITASVSVDSDSAQNAFSQIKAKTEALKAILIRSGVSEEDISVSQITSVPLNLVNPGTYGFQAGLQIGVKTKNVSSIGDLVADLYAGGASLVTQPTLAVDDQGSLETKAINEAIKDAKSKINPIALKNLKLFRKIVLLDIQSTSTTSTSTSKADTITEAKDAVAAQNGVFKIAKVASISYKLW